MTYQVKVINGNNFEIVDHFDGMAYKFPAYTGNSKAPAEGVNIPLDAATHIFGVDFPPDKDTCNSEEFRQQVFTHLQKRWGWNSMEPKSISQYEKNFRNIAFVPVIFKLVENEAKYSEEMPTPREVKQSVKGSSFKPRVDEDTEESVA